MFRFSVAEFNKKRARPAAERFDRFVTAEPNTGCLLWMGTYGTGGYPKFCDETGKNVYAHKYAFEAMHGPVPDGLMVLHRCDVPGCVNQKHLWLGTAMDNTKDMIAKGRHRVGARKKNARLNDEIVRELRSSAERNAIVARRLGISVSLVEKVRSGERWAHVK